MHAIAVAFKAFFAALFNAARRQQIERVLEGAALELPANTAEAATLQPVKPQPKPVEPKKPLRNDALTLLATLQREARLVDFLQEPIDAYNDAQIGAAVRDIHRDCRGVLERLFGLQSVVPQEEGAAIDVPHGFDAARYSLTGNVGGRPPYRGTLSHHGWLATRCELPTWTGSADGAMVVAAAEVELK